MSNFMGVGIFWIGLNRADLSCWRLTLKSLHFILAQSGTSTELRPLSI